MYIKNKKLIIAIDGPAGSGKSTIAEKLSELLDIFHLNSGALYRIIGLYLNQQGISPKDSEKVEAALQEINIEIKDNKYFLNGKDVTEEIKTLEAGKLASAFSQNPSVRKKVNEIIKDVSKSIDIVVDGRDIGTVVLPHSDLKIFLTATLEERARRRWKELKAKGENVSYQEILNEIYERDNADSKRSIAPLKPAKDALIIDTTNKSIQEVVEEILSILRRKE